MKQTKEQIEFKQYLMENIKEQIQKDDKIKNLLERAYHSQPVFPEVYILSEWKLSICINPLLGILYPFRKRATGFIPPSFCDRNKKKIYLNEEAVTEEVFMHELLHALSEKKDLNGQYITGFKINENWRIFNEVMTESIVYFIIFDHDIYPLSMYGYKGPFYAIEKSFRSIDKHKFLEAYLFATDDEICNFMNKIKEKDPDYDLNNILKAFSSYNKTSYIRTLEQLNNIISAMTDVFNEIN